MIIMEGSQMEDFYIAWGDSISVVIRWQWGLLFDFNFRCLWGLFSNMVHR